MMETLRSIMKNRQEINHQGRIKKNHEKLITLSKRKQFPWEKYLKKILHN